MKTAGSALTVILKKNKYVLLVLALGLVLLLLPSGRRGGAEASAVYAQEPTGDELTILLSEIEGVGEAYSLVSEFGAVVVCDGARDAQTRLNVINAVSAYTGFGSDRICVIQRK